MSVRTRLDDSNFLFLAGRLESAFLLVLVAVAATARKRYPKLGDRARFEAFLVDERPKTTGGKEITLDLAGKTWTLEELLYKLLRNSLVHEGELDAAISIDYGTFLLEKRAGHDHLTLSSELLILLSYVVATARENAEECAAGPYDGLPEPADLTATALIRFQQGDAMLEFACYAASLRRLPWKDSGEMHDWLHAKALPLNQGHARKDANPMTILVPLPHLTSLVPGPTFSLSKRRATKDIGVFPPCSASGTISASVAAEFLERLRRPTRRHVVVLECPADGST